MVKLRNLYLRSYDRSLLIRANHLIDDFEFINKGNITNEASIIIKKDDKRIYVCGGNIGALDTVLPPSVFNEYSYDDDIIKVANFVNDSSPLLFRQFAILKSSGQIYVAGINSNGVLGLNLTSNIHLYRFKLLNSDTDWVNIWAGDRFFIAKKLNGTLWAWGFNSNGQLGLGDFTTRYSPEQIGTDTDWDYVATGISHVLALKTNGTLWGWGLNNNYQLGLGDNINRNSPTQIGTFNNWVKIAAGTSHSGAVNSSGELYCWGSRISGKVGDGLISGFAVTPVNILPYTDWVDIKCGGNHTIGLRINGNVYGWGLNTSGQLGVGDNTNKNVPTLATGVSNVTKICGANSSSIALDASKNVYVTGRNNHGQLGLGDNIDRNTYTLVTSINNVDNLQECNVGRHHFLIKNNKIYNTSSINEILFRNIAIPYFNESSHTLPFGQYPIKLSTCSGGSIMIVANSGRLYAIGSNSYGQLGLGDTTYRTSYTQVGTGTAWNDVAGGFSHFLILDNFNNLYSVGINTNGELGLGYTSSYSPILNSVSGSWKKISTGYSHNCCISTSGHLYSWGSNNYGELGHGDTIPRYSPTQIGTSNNYKDVSCGILFTIVLTDTNDLYACGYNDNGQLGQGDTISRTSLTLVPISNVNKISCGIYHVAVIKTDGTLWTWGNNTYGQLGLGDFSDRYSPVQVGTSNNWKDVFCYGHKTYVINNNNEIWCAGIDYNGTLGTKDKTQLFYNSLHLLTI